MVVFGAGASYDSAQEYRPPYGAADIRGRRPPVDAADIRGWRPPLADDLFLDPHRRCTEIIESYPKIRGILQPLRAHRNHTVEEVLESFQAQAPNHLDRYSQLASVRYYLRDLLFKCTINWLRHTSGVTNYATLVDQILLYHDRISPICFVTFNYDLLLEDALIDRGFHPPDDPKLFSSCHPFFKVFKLHGSVNWGRIVKDRPLNESVKELIESAAYVESPTSEALTAWKTVEYMQDKSSNGMPLYPCISIPVQKKDEKSFQCPPNHLYELVQMISSVNNILIVGWQAKEAHFMELLRKHLRRLDRLQVVVGSEQLSTQISRSFLEQLGENAAACRTDTYRGGFTDFVGDGAADGFLGS
jgi:hypothetical protein